MKNLIIVIVLTIMTRVSVSAQQGTYTEDDYYPLVENGFAALQSEKYDSCITYFKNAFTIRQTSYLSTLRAAACAYSKGDEIYLDKQLDKAFSLSWIGVKEVWDNYKEFTFLKGTPFEDRILKMYDNAVDTSGVNMRLLTEFKGIDESDQRHRKEMRGVSEKYGWKSPQMDSLWALQNPIDKANTERISFIIDSCGYPGRSIVGPTHASTAFLVIQHADIEVQEKYLDIITAAADAGEVRWSSVALLVDRIRMRNGEPQLYGSQINTNKETGEYYFAKIAEPYKIDSLRATVGLGPLQSYADHWNFEWNPDKHIERHKQLEKKKENESEEKK